MIVIIITEENCKMPTRADFDAVKQAIVDAIKAAAARFGTSGVTFTDQDWADLKKDVDDINALGGGGGGGETASLSITPTFVPASTQATVTLTAPAPTSDQDWAITFFPDVVTAPPVVTLPAGHT